MHNPRTHCQRDPPFSPVVVVGEEGGNHLRFMIEPGFHLHFIVNIGFHLHIILKLGFHYVYMRVSELALGSLETPFDRKVFG